MLTSAREHYERQQRISAAGLIAARRAWVRGDTGRVVSAVVAAQLVAARDAVESVPLMLAEQGLSTDAAGEVDPRAFAGVASDGRPLASLLAIPETLPAFELIVATQLQDAARGAAGVATVAHPVATGYVRMLNPPSCSRCAVLAGRFYKWNKGFLRHPRCDCRHVPSSEATATDLTTNPDAYFRSLSPTEQDKHFTKAGAQAIRDGADISQVVNARRGMSAAGVTRTTTREIGGEAFTVNVRRRTLSTNTTTEGGTRRGVAGRAMGAKRRQTVTRLTPESIYAWTESREEALRLLRANGYFL
jgi:hypothetical protein